MHRPGTWYAHLLTSHACAQDDKPPAHALRGKPGHMHTRSRPCCAHLHACLAREKRRQSCARTMSHACASACRMKSSRFTAGAELCKVTAQRFCTTRDSFHNTRRTFASSGTNLVTEVWQGFRGRRTFTDFVADRALSQGEVQISCQVQLLML